MPFVANGLPAGLYPASDPAPPGKHSQPLATSRIHPLQERGYWRASCQSIVYLHRKNNFHLKPLLAAFYDNRVLAWENGARKRNQIGRAGWSGKETYRFSYGVDEDAVALFLRGVGASPRCGGHLGTPRDSTCSSSLSVGQTPGVADAGGWHICANSAGASG